MLTSVYLDEFKGHVPLEDKFKIKSANMQLNVSVRGEEKVFGELNKMYSASCEDMHMTPLGQKKLLKILDENLGKNDPFILAMHTSGTTVTDVDSWIRIFRLVRNKARVVCLEAQKYEAFCQPFYRNSRTSHQDEQKYPDNNHEGQSNKSLKREIKSNNKYHEYNKMPWVNLCNICRRDNHPREECHCKDHSDRNPDRGTLFADILKGKEWKKNFPHAPFWNQFRDLDGTSRVSPGAASKVQRDPPTVGTSKPFRTKSHKDYISTHLNNDSTHSDFPSVTIPLVQPKAKTQGQRRTRW
jgi:hypothetical protein